MGRVARLLTDSAVLVEHLLIGVEDLGVLDVQWTGLLQVTRHLGQQEGAYATRRQAIEQPGAAMLRCFGIW